VANRPVAISNKDRYSARSLAVPSTMIYRVTASTKFIAALQTDAHPYSLVIFPSAHAVTVRATAAAAVPFHVMTVTYSVPRRYVASLLDLMLLSNVVMAGEATTAKKAVILFSLGIPVKRRRSTPCQLNPPHTPPSRVSVSSCRTNSTTPQSTP
jgi:hypothetical protein